LFLDKRMAGACSVVGRWTVAALAAALPVAVAFAGKKPEPPPLPVEHIHSSGAFSFRTPEGWVLSASTERPEILDAWGGELGVRFLFQERDVGYDGLHVTCMLERLAAPMDTSPEIRYEYEFIGGPFADRRALDSAFVIKYDDPVRGYREWRQRTLTVVGAGQSLCAMSYAPMDLWRKVKTRALLDAVLASVSFRAPSR
jgi:hypothetical protein